MATSLLCILLFLPLGFSIHFNITRFEANNLEKVLFQGDAIANNSDGTVELNIVKDFIYRTGRVISADRVRLWDADSRRRSDFTTSFSFTIDMDTQGNQSNNYGNGLAFFLAPVGFEIPPNSGGPFLGLFNTTTTTDSSKAQIVHVEFDSRPSRAWDPKFEHVGINNNSLHSVVSTPWNASFHNGDTADVWINYNATNMNFNVAWSYRHTPNPKETSSLSCQINLTKVLPEWVIVGFSASTGTTKERHILRSWEFTSSLDIEEREHAKNNQNNMRLVVGLTVSGGVLVVSLFVGFVVLYWKRNHKKIKENEMVNLTSINEELQRGAVVVPRRFSYNDLVSATNNFSSDRKLGKGGSGSVYKGNLKDPDVEVAVKKIAKESKQGRKEYVTEVQVISRLRHRNLVQLIGWCHERAEFLIIYEFMPNGSLDRHLFGNGSPLSWALRYKISLGLASALLYLHEGWEQCVVHRDIKPSNVMLDSDFNVKVGDFGLARLRSHELDPQTTGLAGTVGYLAPEYITTRRASKESDVYSFGVVVLEIVTGRKSTDFLVKENQMGLVKCVWDLYGMGQLLSAMDKKLLMDFDQTQIECLMLVGLWCAYPDLSLRPSIRQAIHVLNFEAPLPNLPPKMPMPSYHVPASESAKSVCPSITTSFEQGR